MPEAWGSVWQCGKCCHRHSCAYGRARAARRNRRLGTELCGDGAQRSGSSCRIRIGARKIARFYQRLVFKDVSAFFSCTVERSMKVLVLHSELGVLRGGGENFTRNLFAAFAERGHSVAAAF